MAPWRPAAARGKGTVLGDSCALGPSPKIHTLRPAVGSGSVSGGSKSWGPRPHPGGDPGHPGGLLRPARGHQPGKQLRHGHRPKNLHAAAHGGPRHRLRQLQALGATSSPGGDPGHPDGLLRPKRGHRSGKQLRPGLRLRPGVSHATSHGVPWHRLRRLQALGHVQPRR